MEKVMTVLKTTKILGIIGAILLIVGNFFDFATAEFLGIKASVTLIGDELECPWVLILGILALALVFIDFIIAKVPEGKADFLKYLRNPKFALVPAILSAIVLFSQASDKSGIIEFSYVKAGFGFYLLVIGTIALAVYPFLYKDE